MCRGSAGVWGRVVSSPHAGSMPGWLALRQRESAVVQDAPCRVPRPVDPAPIQPDEAGVGHRAQDRIVGGRGPVQRADGADGVAPGQLAVAVRSAGRSPRTGANRSGRRSRSRRPRHGRACLVAVVAGSGASLKPSTLVPRKSAGRGCHRQRCSVEGGLACRVRSHHDAGVALPGGTAGIDDLQERQLITRMTGGRGRFSRRVRLPGLSTTKDPVLD